MTAPGIAFGDLPPIDTVLLSHNHYDHLDLATLDKLVARDDPLIVTPLGNDTISFQLTDEPRDESPERLASALNLNKAVEACVGRHSSTLARGYVDLGHSPNG